MVYPLGWPIVAQMLIQRERWPGGYKIKSAPLVQLNQGVRPDQPVMRLERTDFTEAVQELPRLSLPATPPGGLTGAAGYSDRRKNEIVPSGLYGTVVAITPRGGVVIESHAALVQGAIGAGKQVAGVLTLWQATGAPGTTGHTQPYIPPGAILVVPGPLNFAMLRQALNSGVAAVIASSISARDLEGFLRIDLIELLSKPNLDLAQTHLPAMTVMLTEGLGTFAMPVRTINLLSQHQGSIALISGATSARQRVFPELIISLAPQEVQENWQPVKPDPTLVLGASVRICAGSYEGAVGEINYLFAHMQVFPSGVRERAARVRLEDGSLLVVPLALLERLS